MTGTNTTFDAYGLRIRVEGSWPDALEELRRDFWWFRAEDGGPADVVLAIENEAPALDRFGGLRSSFVTPRNVVYQGEEVTVVEYFGEAAIVIDRATGSALLQGTDLELVREAASNFLISRIGEHLNRRGLVRLHALGLAGEHGATCVVMPSGGGKSTLAVKAIGDERCRILSEDSPLLDRSGSVHPFPLRIGVNPVDEALVPPGLSVRRQERIEFHAKLALDVESWADRVEPGAVPLANLVVGRRTLDATGTLVQLRRREALAPLLREAVVGVGVYQGMEFVLQRGWRDVFLKSGTAVRRARVAGGALRRVDVWELRLGRDRDSNWAALEPLLA